MRVNKITRQDIEIIENTLLIETDIFIFNKISDNKSTFVAKKLGRKWIGIEKEMEYCEISDYRFSCHKGEVF